MLHISAVSMHLCLRTISSVFLRDCRLIWATADWLKTRLLQVLGDICACHTANDEQVLELPHETNGFGSDYAHPRFAAMLLRLGDLLDVDNGRFNMVAEEMIGGLPATSEAHKGKSMRRHTSFDYAGKIGVFQQLSQ